MKLILERYIGADNHTIGVLQLKGFLHESMLCYTLEDEFRNQKVAGKTRIPAGTYEITLRKEGRIHNNYLAKFGSSWHQGVLWIRNIKGFEYVYIHIGQDQDDTLGCILTGESVANNRLQNSTVAYKKIYPIIRDALLKGEKVEIKIIDFDRGFNKTIYFLHKIRFLLLIAGIVGVAYLIYANRNKILPKQQ